MAHWMWDKQLTLISGPWHSIRSGISDRVWRTYYLTYPSSSRVYVPPLTSAYIIWPWAIQQKLNFDMYLLCTCILTWKYLYWWRGWQRSCHTSSITTKAHIGKFINSRAAIDQKTAKLCIVLFTPGLLTALISLSGLCGVVTLYPCSPGSASLYDEAEGDL